MKFYANNHTKTHLTHLLKRIKQAIYEPVAELEITAWRKKEDSLCNLHLTFYNFERIE